MSDAGVQRAQQLCGPAANFDSAQGSVRVRFRVGRPVWALTGAGKGLLSPRFHHDRVVEAEYMRCPEGRPCQAVASTGPNLKLVDARMLWPPQSGNPGLMHASCPPPDAIGKSIPLPEHLTVCAAAGGSTCGQSYVWALWCPVRAWGAGRIGEGSFGQLVRRYGCEGARQVVARLGCVWISHIHADHHAGLPRLLAVRAGSRCLYLSQQMSVLFSGHLQWPRGFGVGSSRTCLS